MGIFDFWKKKERIVNFQEPSLDALKKRITILFVDDEKFTVVENLISNGWTQTKHVKDIQNLDSPEVHATHIFFVDIQGVGRKLNFSDEGLGLARALKEKFPSKIVIIYSAQQEGDRFDKTFAIVDDSIRKNADTYEFIRITEQYSKELFSPLRAISRIQQLIKDETGSIVPVEQIERALFSKRNEAVDTGSISSALDVSAKLAEAISSIIGVVKAFQ